MYEWYVIICDENVWWGRTEQKKKSREENNLFLTNKEVDSFLNVFLKTASHSPFFWFHKNCQQSNSQRFPRWIITKLFSLYMFSFLSLSHFLIFRFYFPFPHIYQSFFSFPPWDISFFVKTHVVLRSYMLNFLPLCITPSVRQHVQLNSFKSKLICIAPFRKEAALLWRFPEERNICCWSCRHPLLPPNFVLHTEHFSISRNCYCPVWPKSPRSYIRNWTRT